jgi:hypothetical protein
VDHRHQTLEDLAIEQQDLEGFDTLEEAERFSEEYDESLHGHGPPKEEPQQSIADVILTGMLHPDPQDTPVVSTDSLFQVKCTREEMELLVQLLESSKLNHPAEETLLNQLEAILEENDEEALQPMTKSDNLCV